MATAWMTHVVCMNAKCGRDERRCYKSMEDDNLLSPILNWETLKTNKDRCEVCGLMPV
ncbi:hypothetical protein DPMN_041562 [Dreissena polymorpha]|uniref:Uncharacterized protein n=1 Tax=Dreissena polymorpha TaxID=45954 RepID=A0A9D4HY04_DREPO|nr:hypothetical protein DPMN_041562 [Dreissena polymorpha]